MEKSSIFNAKDWHIGNGRIVPKVVIDRVKPEERAAYLKEHGVKIRPYTARGQAIGNIGAKRWKQMRIGDTRWSFNTASFVKRVPERCGPWTKNEGMRGWLEEAVKNVMSSSSGVSSGVIEKLQPSGSIVVSPRISGFTGEEKAQGPVADATHRSLEGVWVAVDSSSERVTPPTPEADSIERIVIDFPKAVSQLEAPASPVVTQKPQASLVEEVQSALDGTDPESLKKLKKSIEVFGKDESSVWLWRKTEGRTAPAKQNVPPKVLKDLKGHLKDDALKAVDGQELLERAGLAAYPLNSSWLFWEIEASSKGSFKACFKGYLWENGVVSTRGALMVEDVKELLTEYVITSRFKDSQFIAQVPMPIKVGEQYMSLPLWAEQNGVAFLKSKATLKQRVLVSADASFGLAHLHAAGILHRDLKPLNLLIVNGRGKLTDTGGAHDESKVQKKPFGTFDYLAPEIKAGLKNSRATDAYALGIMLGELLSGQYAHRRVFFSDGWMDLPTEVRQAVAPLAKIAPNMRPLPEKVGKDLMAVHSKL